MIIGTLLDGRTCVYDLPKEIDTVEKFTSLIREYNDKPWQRDELQAQPILAGLNGPMYNGTAYLQSTGEEVTIIRYEQPTEL